MVAKSAIGASLLAALVTVVLVIASFVDPVRSGAFVTERTRYQADLVDGRAYLLVLRSSDPTALRNTEETFDNLFQHFAGKWMLYYGYHFHATLCRNPPDRWFVSVMGMHKPYDSTRHTFIRFSLWIPFGFFLAVPGVALIRGPFRRYRLARQVRCVD